MAADRIGFDGQGDGSALGHDPAGPGPVVSLGPGWLLAAGLADAVPVTARGEVAPLGAGDETVILGDGERIDLLQLDDGNDTVTLTGDAQIRVIDVAGGVNSVTTGGTRIASLLSHAGVNTVAIGSGGAGFVHLTGEEGGGALQTVTVAGHLDRLRIADANWGKVTVDAAGGIARAEFSDGADWLSVTGRVDDADMGAGGDTVRLEDGGRAESIRSRSGADLVDLKGDASAEDILTGLGNDTVRLEGTGSVASVATHEGNDAVYLGRASVGRLDLGTGDDLLWLSGFAGKQAVEGGAGSDRIDASLMASAVTVALDGSGGGLRATGFEDLRGSAFGDLLTGDAAVNRISGADGNDRIKGGGGGDFLTGNKGFDLIEGGNGNDTVSGGTGFDTLDGGEGNDILNGDSGQDTILGGGGNDRLSGGDSDDLLSGGNNADTLTGGTGDDNLSGGAGYDVFAFDLDSGYDRITDFDLLRDTILIDGVADLSGITFTEAGQSSLTRLQFGASTVVLFGVSMTELQEDGHFLFV